MRFIPATRPFHDPLPWHEALKASIVQRDGRSALFAPRDSPVPCVVTSEQGMDMRLRGLVGSGDRIGLLALPFVVVGLILSVADPSMFSVGGPAPALRMTSIVMLVPGLVIWVWSVTLILTKASKNELITDGPYALVKHPLYTGVALLVLPWIGFLLDSWLGLVIGVVVYVGSRLFAPAEEAALSRRFGASWNAYRDSVKVPWL